MSSRKLSVEEQAKLIPDDDIHKSFLEREDIACLTPEEQERRWQKQLEGIKRWRTFLSESDSFVLGE